MLVILERVMLKKVTDLRVGHPPRCLAEREGSLYVELRVSLCSQRFFNVSVQSGMLSGTDKTPGGRQVLTIRAKFTGIRGDPVTL